MDETDFAEAVNNMEDFKRAVDYSLVHRCRHRVRAWIGWNLPSPRASNLYYLFTWHDTRLQQGRQHLALRSSADLSYVSAKVSSEHSLTFGSLTRSVFVDSTMVM